MLGDVDSVVPFITVNEQSESNPDWNFQSSIAYFASGRLFHQNVFNRFTTNPNLAKILQTVCNQRLRRTSRCLFRSKLFDTHSFVSDLTEMHDIALTGGSINSTIVLWSFRRFLSRYHGALSNHLPKSLRYAFVISLLGFWRDYRFNDNESLEKNCNSLKQYYRKNYECISCPDQSSLKIPHKHRNAYVVCCSSRVRFCE